METTSTGPYAGRTDQVTHDVLVTDLDGPLRRVSHRILATDDGTKVDSLKLGDLDHNALAATLGSKGTDGKVIISSFQRQEDSRKAMNKPTYVPALAVLLLMLLCLGWLMWGIALTVEMTMTVNKLMNTEAFDGGTFWYLSVPSLILTTIGATGLTSVGIGYLITMGNITSMLWYRNNAQPRERRSRFDSLHAKVLDVRTNLQEQHAQEQQKHRSRSADSMKLAVINVTAAMLDKESITRRKMASMIKIANIIVECIQLGQFLEGGLPVPMCGLYACIVAMDAMTSCIFSLLPYDNMGYVHTIVDTGFDLVVAVIFPMIQVLYAKYQFQFDYQVYNINQAVFPPGFFDRMAAVNADPVRVELIRHVLLSLRIDSILKIFTRVGTSVSLWHRFVDLAELLRAQFAGIQRHPNVYPKQNRPFAVLYGLLCLLIIVGTEESIRTAGQACAMHTECVQHAHHWVYDRQANDFYRCPCISLIDREVVITSYDDWVNPPSRINKVAQLAASGYLETLQLVNRGLETVPDQLRGCRQLRHVSLSYTNTRTLPDWFGELENLEFLHLEGKDSGPDPQASVESLPPTTFDKMSKLTFLHLALHKIRTLPSFDGLVNIRYITLAVMVSLEAVPSLDNLVNLQQLTVGCLVQVKTLPRFDNLHQLQQFVIVDRGQFCCNGYLGTCNLAHEKCAYDPLFQLPAITQCVSSDQVATDATKAVFKKYEAMCTGVIPPGLLELPPTRASMEQCNGTVYRKCDVPGLGPGMCYNPRWMGVSCNLSPFAISARRQQIAQKIGKPCDPMYEAWLGC